MMEYDVIVVGGSFAGLNFARVATINGLKVLVLERQKKIAEHIGSTGIFIKEIPEIFQIPNKFCTNAIQKMYLYSPSFKSMEISSNLKRFYMTDTKGYLRWLADLCQKWGVDIKIDSNYINKKDMGNKILIKFKEKDNFQKIKCKFVIGADGALSEVANSFNLSKNKEFLIGTEHILTKSNDIEKDAFYCFLNYSLAPGYLGWIAPNEDSIHIGLAGYKDKFNPTDSLKKFEEKISKQFDLSKSKILERKTGLIPVGGMLPKTYTNKCLLLGDAAGMVNSLSGGGIFPSLMYSIKAGEYIADYILNNNKEALKDYSTYAKELQYHLSFSHHLRTVYNTLNSNKLLEDIFDLFKTKEGKELIKRLYLNSQAKEHGWRTILLGFEEFLRDTKTYPLFGKLILDEIT